MYCLWGKKYSESKDMMYFKKHMGQGRILIAICDENLLGKTFSEGEYSLKVSERFYKGKKVKKEELKETLKNSENINLVGKEIIDFALELGVLNKGSILEVSGVPHAQVIKI